MSNALRVVTNPKVLTDPNTIPSSPPEAIAGAPRGVPTPLWVAPADGGMTVQLWVFLASLRTWFRIGPVTSCPAGALTVLETPPSDVDQLFCQVVAADPSLRAYALGLLGDRT